MTSTFWKRFVTQRSKLFLLLEGFCYSEEKRNLVFVTQRSELFHFLEANRYPEKQTLPLSGKVSLLWVTELFRNWSTLNVSICSSGSKNWALFRRGAKVKMTESLFSVSIHNYFEMTRCTSERGCSDAIFASLHVRKWALKERSFCGSELLELP